MLELIHESGRASGRLIQEMIAGKQSVRDELDVPARRDIFEAANRRKLLRQTFDALRHIRPVVIFALPEYGPRKRHAPGLLGSVREPQALERNRKKNDVAVVPNAACVIPQRVEAIVVALPLGIDRIGLHAERIGKKIIGAVKIPKRIQQYSHAVVLVRSLALREVRADFPRFIAAHESNIEILVVIGKVSGR